MDILAELALDPGLADPRTGEQLSSHARMSQEDPPWSSGSSSHGGQYWELREAILDGPEE